MKYLKIFFGFLLTVVLLQSCAIFRNPYESVRIDPYRSAKEREKLAEACHDEFPVIISGDTVIKTGVDSSDYYAALDAYNQMLDQYIVAKDSVIALLKIIQAGGESGVTNEQIVLDILRASRERDSVIIIKNFLKWYKPKPIIEYRDKIQWKYDSSVVTTLQGKIRVCQENEAKNEDTIDGLKPWKTRFFIAVGVGVLAIILLIMYLIRQMRKGVIAKAKPPKKTST